jgi:hypothetical protein
MEAARERYWSLSEDERLQEIKQGKQPEQVVGSEGELAEA